MHKQQEIAEPPAELIPENQDPQQNNYLGADFNRADPKAEHECGSPVAHLKVNMSLGHPQVPVGLSVGSPQVK